MKLEVAQVIDRPVADVFRFYADEHVRNHPRWDPDMELEQVSHGPIGVGTLIRRRHTHTGVPVAGTMEVVEFVPNQAFGVVIHDGPLEMHGRATFTADSPHRTTLTISAEMPGRDAPMDPSVMRRLMERSAHTIKHLVESEGDAS